MLGARRRRDDNALSGQPSEMKRTGGPHGGWDWVGGTPKGARQVRARAGIPEGSVSQRSMKVPSPSVRRMQASFRLPAGWARGRVKEN